HRSHDHPPGQVPDLGLALGHLAIPCIERRFPAGRRRRCAASAAHSRGGCRTRRGSGMVLALAGSAVTSAIGGGLDDQRAVDHVHPAREPELPGLRRVQPHRGLLVGRQRRAHLELGEHHPGRAGGGTAPPEKAKNTTGHGTPPPPARPNSSSPATPGPPPGPPGLSPPRTVTVARCTPPASSAALALRGPKKNQPSPARAATAAITTTMSAAFIATSRNVSPSHCHPIPHGGIDLGPETAGRSASLAVPLRARRPH